jgi:hypothetical protein
MSIPCEKAEVLEIIRDDIKETKCDLKEVKNDVKELLLSRERSKGFVWGVSAIISTLVTILCNIAVIWIKK